MGNEQTTDVKDNFAKHRNKLNTTNNSLNLPQIPPQTLNHRMNTFLQHQHQNPQNNYSNAMRDDDNTSSFSRSNPYNSAVILFSHFF